MDAHIHITPYFQEKSNSQKINFIEEIIVKQDKKDFKIEFGMNELNEQEIIIKVIQNNSNNLFCFQNKYNQKNFHNYSKIFYI